ncbi:nuclear transport factor 2 family protein [Motilibacter aurantiacus]|uniref:nuclear transport factor 2 family protein n=1 Tax=Motilibacter aurantiacus TaxID=2714955 RepID=UPI002F2B6E43
MAAHDTAHPAASPPADSVPPTAPELAGVLAELRDREPLFHRPELGVAEQDLERQLAPDFFEVGASGRRYGRQHVKRALLERYAAGGDDPWETSGFHCRELGPGTYLLTYTLRQGDRVTRRSTVWRRAGGSWQVLYHQGTPVSG